MDLNPNQPTISGKIWYLQVTGDGVIVNTSSLIETPVQFDVTYQLRDSPKKHSAYIQLFYHNNQLHREGGKPAVLLHVNQYNLKYIERRLNGERLAFQFISQ